MEHVLKFDEFMKNKCGRGIKRKYYVYKGAWEIGRRKKMGVVNCVWCVKEKTQIVEKGHMKKKWKKRKVKRKKEKYKAKNVHDVKKIET